MGPITAMALLGLCVRLFLVCLVSGQQYSRYKQGTRLPAKGATTGSIIGAIIGAVILIAIIGTGIAMYRKLKNNKLNGERPPKHKPPPPQKNNSAPKQVNSSHAAVTESLRQNEYIPAPTAEQVADPDGYHDDEGDDYDEGTHNGGYYYSGSPQDWDEPSNSEALRYNMASDRGYYNQGPNVNREDSFVSSAMIV